MSARTLLTVSILLSPAFADTTAERRGQHALHLSASAPTVTVAPRSPGGRSIRLPALEYVFRLRPDCDEPFQASSVSLTVADSRKFLDAEQLRADPPTTELRLTVPANQIPPVSIADFCIAPDDPAPAEAAPRTDAVTVPGALSANASLLCVENDKQEILYTSASLDVNLVCAAADGPDE